MYSADSTTTIISTLLLALYEVSCVAGRAEELVSRDSEYAGAVVPHTLAVIQQRAEMALQKPSAIMKADISAAENAVKGGPDNV